MQLERLFFLFFELFSGLWGIWELVRGSNLSFSFFFGGGGGVMFCKHIYKFVLPKWVGESEK